MPVSTKEQTLIQERLEAASRTDRDRMRRDAEALLSLYAGNAVMPRRQPSSMERRDVETAIEVILRLECLDNDGGWWFRQKRRYALMRQYLGP